MPPTVDEPSVSSQEGQISLTLSLLMLQQFLFGIYTGVLLITLYGYYGKATGKWIITGTMIMLYILTATVVSIDWKYAQIMFCDVISSDVIMPSIDLRSYMYVYALDGPLLSFSNAVQQPIILNIAQFGGLILADGLLVWRCFHACGQSFRHTVLPMVLFIIEAGLAICATVYTYSLFVPHDSVLNSLTQSTDVLANRIAGSALLSTALTSLVCTFMICRQIYKYTSWHNSGTRRRYRQLLLMLVQSSGAYSATVCVKAIFELIGKEHPVLVTETPRGAADPSLFASPSSYTSVVVSVVVGLVPTLMIASVSWSRSGNDRLEVFSGTFSVPLDIGTEEPHFATQSQMTDGSDDINLTTDEPESRGEYENSDSQIVAGKEVDYLGGVFITEPCRAL
ncbi:hypothetical protein D9613_008029 [Agrocybe pediades]|uniref:Uncharacterized protein n=1 Tax=Agrocybe pediades TaxID=84607 RepID=A0A8H4VNH1_9AGAR|nr:hypothetical protein D9613_008029 [Agrocybe pediades]